MRANTTDSGSEVVEAAGIESAAVSPQVAETQGNRTEEELRLRCGPRFWRRVAIGHPKDCWRWLGHLDRDGYGRYSITKTGKISAHRCAWLLTFGPIPDGLVVAHACDVPSCCNPMHLWIGTQHANNLDRQRKGRTVLPPPKP